MKHILIFLLFIFFVDGLLKAETTGSGDFSLSGSIENCAINLVVNNCPEVVEPVEPAHVDSDPIAEPEPAPEPPQIVVPEPEPTPKPAPVPEPPTAAPSVAQDGTLFLTGLNLAGGEFGKNIPGKLWQDYVYPSTGSVDYWLSKGFNSLRIPVKWDRIQRSPYAELDSGEIANYRQAVDHAISKGAWVIVDVHNYNSYRVNGVKKQVGKDLDRAVFADLWSKLAEAFPHERVIYGLMNEPHDIDSVTNVANMQTAVDAIRATGAKNKIFVPANGWSGAHSFIKNGNGDAMKAIVDPANNYAIEVHQYLDGNSSGTSGSCVNENIGVERLKSVTQWAKEHGKKLFLGEFAGGNNDTCKKALVKMLDYMSGNKSAWLGWSFWAGGPWWGNYYFSIEPKNGSDDQRTKILQQYIN